jgi:hypothetical protein
MADDGGRMRGYPRETTKKVRVGEEVKVVQRGYEDEYRTGKQEE